MGPFDLLLPLPADRRGREPDANAWIDLHNVIVAAEHVDDFGPRDLERISRQRRVNLADRFIEKRIDLYQQYLDWAIEGEFSDADRELLAHIAETLHLHPEDLRDAHRRAFGTAVHQALADDCLSVDERLLLYKLQHTLGLDPDLASGAYEVMARERLLVTIARVLCDGELSPEEAAEVEHAQEAIGMTVPDRVTRMLDAAAARWHERNTPEAPPPRKRTAKTPSRFSTTGHWRRVAVDRLLKVFGASGGLASFARGDTFHHRVPPVALRGIRAVGRIAVKNDRLVLAPKRETPRVYIAGAISRALRFNNGVLVETRDEQAVFIETRDAADLYAAIERMLESRSDGSNSWMGRWRPFYAPERDVALSKLSPRVPAHKRPTAALGELRRTSGWIGFGDLDLERDTLLLRHKGDTKKVTVRNLRGVYHHRRLVWIDRRSTHDWLVEFSNEEDALSFANALLVGETD